MITSFLQPNWPAPQNIRAFTTLRQGGVSQAPYNEFNLAQHVHDNPQHVTLNRALLKEKLNLPAEPVWIEQTHSTIALTAQPSHRNCEADATFTTETNQVSVILTADCLPILLCSIKEPFVASIHAGWRGLANGIIESTLAASQQNSHHLIAWLGPAISAAHYEVGDEVRNYFLNADSMAETAFTPSLKGRWLANLYALARLRLAKAGVSEVYGGDYCTFSDPQRFFSYRRDGSQTGRMATLIWITS